MKPVVVVDENIPWVEHYLGHAVDIHAVPGRSMAASHLADADALLVRSVTQVNQSLLAEAPVRFVGSATSGTDHVDIDFLKRAGIAFAHAPGSNTNAVVEYVLAVIAAVDDKLEQLLLGGRAGIVGYGVIGKMLASRFASLGIPYCVYDPWLAPSAIKHCATLGEVLACDVISLHAELTHQQPWPSYHLFADTELASLKDEALLLNASRGAVVNNASLLCLLQQETLDANVVLDVWEGEPVINAELLRRVRYGSPHVAGYSLDGKALATRMLCDKLAESLGVVLQNLETPLAPPEPITLVKTRSDAEFLRQLLHCRYDIAIDDSALRDATLDRRSGDAAVAFDRLRREYRLRRELPGTIVRGIEFSQRQLRWLDALGCEPSLEGVVS